MPVDPASLLAGRTRETKIVRDGEGRWYNDGVRIVHPLLTQAFDAWLVRAPDGSGRWCLSNDINWAFVSIEGPPRFVRSVRIAGGRIVARVSDGREVRLALEALRQGPEGALYCDVGDGMIARFERHAMMQLEDVVGEDERGVYLALDDRTIRPPVVDDPLAS